jgi:Peptidase_C39 like family
VLAFGAGAHLTAPESLPAHGMEKLAAVNRLSSRLEDERLRKDVPWAFEEEAPRRHGQVMIELGSGRCGVVMTKIGSIFNRQGAMTDTGKRSPKVGRATRVAVLVFGCGLGAALSALSQGYDPCANPNAPPWCAGRAQSGRPVPGVPYACRACAPQMCVTNGELISCVNSQPSSPSCSQQSVLANGVWPPLAALESFTAQIANAERDALVNVLGQMAPQFDMTKSGEGVRYMGTLLWNMGFRYLTANVAAVVRSTLTRTPVQLITPVYSWSPSVGQPYPVASVSSLPPGLRIPQVILNTPRPLQLQEENASCGFACIKMIADTVTRVIHPESYYRSLVPVGPCGYTPGDGTNPVWLARALQKVGVSATYRTGQSVMMLYRATQNGYPAIAHFGATTAGHAVIVDTFAQDSAQNWYVLGRDPFNLNLMDPKDRDLFIKAGSRNKFVLPLGTFSANWDGEAIYTGP